MSTDHAASRAAASPAVAFAASALAAASVAAAIDSSLLLVVAAALVGAVPLVLVGSVSWRVLLGVLILVIVFIPIRRYTFGTGLPIQLEPYRVLAALLLGAWAAALLVDPRARLKPSGLGGPILLIGLVAAASVVANLGRAASVEMEVVKSLSFLVSYLLLFFLIANVTRGRSGVDGILKTLVTGMAVVGFFAIIERRSGWSPFAQLDQYLPLLSATGEDQLVRGSGVRARGPAEHPIALGAALVLVLPASLYLARTAVSRRAVWWSAAAVLAAGALATLSRTGVLMLAVVALVFLWLRTRETLRFWPALLPLLAAIHFALPGTLGSIKASFFPEAGLIQSQQAPAGEYDCSSSGRVADLGPAFDQIARSPLLGIGYGTRVVVGDERSVPPRNACILDNQWLGTLLETGIVGLFAWLWLFLRLIRRLGAHGHSRSAEGDLSVALAASIAAFAVGMLTFDAFGFVQVTFLFFLFAALAASALRRDQTLPQ